MRELEPIKPPTPEERRETVEFFALQAVFRWPALARENEITPACFRGSAARKALAGAALAARFFTASGSVPVATSAAAANVPLDVAMGMLSQGFLPDAGAGLAYLVELLSIERALQLTLATQAALRDSKPDELADALQSALIEHARRCNGKRGTGPIPTLQRLALNFIEARESMLTERREPAVSFGPQLRRLNALLRGGHHRGNMTLITAGPGVGKTTFQRYLEYQVALQGLYVLHFSVEMSGDQHGERLVHAESGRPMSEKLTAADLHRARGTIETSDAVARIITDIRPRLNLAYVASAIIAAKARYGALGLVTIDHLGAIEEKPFASANRKEHERFEDLAKEIKLIAMETEVPINVLQHMLRADGANEDPKWEPTGNSGRGGGGPERWADNQLAIWRNSRGTFAKVLKCRQNGEAKNEIVELLYNSALQAFGEVETHDHRS